MKKLILSCLLLATVLSVRAQITITASDMPVAGDTLRSSTVLPLGATVDLNLTGANAVWDFSGLTPVTQSVDTYKTILQVNPLLAIQLGASSYGFRTSLEALTGGLPIPTLPVSVSDFYSFFQKKANNSRFVARGFSAVISGLPTAIVYSDEDEWYHFPLQFGSSDSSTYGISFSIPGVIGFQTDGNRKTVVDGWGMITTPHFTAPVSCIRLRSVGTEIDSITLGTNTVGIPRITIEYKWLANGEPFPVMWVTTNEVAGQEQVSSIRFRDHYRNLTGINTPSASVRELKAYPNPAADGVVTIQVPQKWQHFTVEVFDHSGRLVFHTADDAQVALSALSSGQYLARVISGNETGYVRIIK